MGMLMNTYELGNNYYELFNELEDFTAITDIARNERTLARCSILSEEPEVQ
jgi:hypothetical protein